MSKLTNKSGWIVETNSTDNGSGLYDPKNLIDNSIAEENSYILVVRDLEGNPIPPSEENPHNITIEFSKVHNIYQLGLYRRVNLSGTGTKYDVNTVKIYTSLNKTNWNYVGLFNLEKIAGTNTSLATLKFEKEYSAKYLRISNIKNNNELRRATTFYEIDVYANDYKIQDNEISGWSDINGKFGTSGTALNYCPAKKEIEAQDLSVEGNYLHNELPLFINIKEGVLEATIANLWIKPGYMIEKDFVYEGQTYKILEMTDSGRQLTEFPDVIDGEQYEVWYYTFARSPMRTFPQVNLTNAISIEGMLAEAWNLVYPLEITLGKCRNFNYSFMGIQAPMTIIGNESVQDVSLVGTFEKGALHIDVHFFRQFGMVPFLSTDSCFSFASLYIFHQHGFEVSLFESHSSAGMFEGSRIDSHTYEGEKLNTVEQMFFESGNPAGMFVKAQVENINRIRGSLSENSFYGISNLKTLNIEDFWGRLDLRESPELSIESIEFIINHAVEDRWSESRLILHSNVLSNISDELKNLAESKNIILTDSY